MSTSRQSALLLLSRALGSSGASFRDGQWEAIDALVNRRERVLVVERTGWGKSTVYFISTRILRDRGRGPTVIVSPLLALMRNQIEAAERIGIRAASINSTNREHWPHILYEIQRDRVDALLVSPERLANDRFTAEVLMPIAASVGMLVVDEVHCISDWGHDFRPDYRRLASVLRHVPSGVPILGTTATANNRVVSDVQTQLGKVLVRRGPLIRNSLELQTILLPSPAARLAWMADHLRSLPGTGIVYTLTKRDAEVVADWLNRCGTSARAYYSGVLGEGFEDTDAYREYLEDRLLRNKFKALVATTALGMGYDKPDLGFVIHFQAPGSVTSYYQQVGRAGRAINRAVGVLLCGDGDSEIHEYFRNSAFPDEEWVRSVLGALEESDGLTTRELEERVNLRTGQIAKVLKILAVEDPAPIIRVGSKWLRTPTEHSIDRDRIRRLTTQREVEWSELMVYVRETGCLMQFLAHALDDPHALACGRCENCRGSPVVGSSFSTERAAEAERFLRGSELFLKCKVQISQTAFSEYDFRGNLPEELRAATGRVLSRWRDGGWGQVVAEGKSCGHFPDSLVHAATELIRGCWKPFPEPKWIACIPSLRNPTLVPSFAQRLSSRLNWPFVPSLTKIKENEPQKLQQNRHHQCRNLDGVFAIVGDVPTDPVLLVDDIVDSAWTLTIASALLRRSGSGPVLPFALATSAMGA